LLLLQLASIKPKLLQLLTRNKIVCCTAAKKLWQKTIKTGIKKEKVSTKKIEPPEMHVMVIITKRYPSWWNKNI